MNLLACATCQANTQGSGDAAGWSILFMLVVILFMLGGLGVLMFRLIRRGSQVEPEFQDHPVPTSARP